MSGCVLFPDRSDLTLPDPPPAAAAAGRIETAAPESVRRYRLKRVRGQLVAAGCNAVLLYDPINIRYATDTANMSLWTMRNPARYALVFAEGPVILWEFHHCAHLHRGNTCVDEIRDAIDWSYFGAGSRADERARAWARELSAELRRGCGDSPVLGFDRAGRQGLALLDAAGVELRDGQSIMERARKIKSADEIALMRRAMRVCEAGVERMRDELRPGMTEQQLWGWLHYENIRNGGEWIETRLLASGRRTNPWMQEASDRVIREGELLAFDTDLIGPFGYCADISRTWIAGQAQPTACQRDLYRYAFEQIQTNAGLLRPGVSYRELSRAAWPIPERFRANRYSFLMHGVGMTDEYPGIHHWGEDWERAGADGRIEANMVISVESYIGEAGGAEGVKLEQQYIVGDKGAEPMCDRFWNHDWL